MTSSGGAGGLILAQITDAVVASIFLTLIALGLFVVFGVMKVINMAHGEMFMLGAYATWWTTAHGLNFWIAIIVATVIVAVIGALIEVAVVRPLYPRKDLSTLLATAGLSLLIQRLVTLGFGAQPRNVITPLGGRVVVAGQSFLTYQLTAAAIALVVIAAVVFVLKRTTLGLIARATIEDPDEAAIFAISGRRVNLTTFAVGCALAGFAGALMSPVIGIDPTMGINFVIQSFLVVITGGSAAAAGTIGGGAIVGGGQSILTANFNGTIAQIIVLAVVMVLVVARPNGIFSRGRGGERA